MTVNTTLEKLRLYIGDTDSAAPLFYDPELQVFLDNNSDNPKLAAIEACMVLATKFARAYDFETDGQRFDRSQMSKAYRELAKALREQASAVTTIDSTRIDGYSDDIANQETSLNTSSANPRRRYYGQEDEIP